MIKLHCFDRSPYGWKARVVLAEKNVPYELVPPPQNKNEDPQFGKMNPFRLTPVLELEDGRTIYESTVIAEYLEDRYPSPAMLPKDPYDRARVRMIEDTTDQYLLAASRKFTMAQFEYAPPLLKRKPAAQIDHKAIEEAKIEIHGHLARLERELQGRTFFGGDAFSLADASLLAPITQGWVTLGLLPDPKYPNIAAWSKRVMERASYKASAPKEPLRIAES
ncbi:MAG: glutathione S-transferase family protein [Acidobacteria bacterium]|nr:glutathione S-transferase family protein [Acidobacteriota bacterium]